MDERTLAEPELVLPDPLDHEIERFFRSIPENDGRVLRVAVNTKVDPARGCECILRPQQKIQTMKLHIDKEADALYLRLDDSEIVESEEVSPGVVLDFNAQNQVVGIEMLGLSLRTPQLNLQELQYQTA